MAGQGRIGPAGRSVFTDMESVALKPASIQNQNRNCPRRRINLVSVCPIAMPDLVIETCTSCEGFWLDENELEAIKALAIKLDTEVANGIECYEKEDKKKCHPFIEAIDHLCGMPRYGDYLELIIALLPLAILIPLIGLLDSDAISDAQQFSVASVL